MDPYKLSLKATPQKQHPTVKFRYSCHWGIKEVPCDGRYHHFEVPSIDLCKNTPKVDRISIFEHEYINNGGKTHQSNELLTEGQVHSYMQLKFSGVMNWIGAMGASGSLILIIIAYILCKS